MRSLLDRLVLIADGLQQDLIDFLEIRRDVIRMCVLDPVRALRIDNNRYTMLMAELDDLLAIGLRAGALAIVRDDYTVQALVEFLTDVAEKALRIRAIDGSDSSKSSRSICWCPPITRSFVVVGRSVVMRP